MVSSPPSSRSLRAIIHAALLTAPFCVLAAVSSPAQAADSGTQQTHEFSIPAGPLAPAINRFAAESGVFVSADGALTAGRSTAGVSGRHTPGDALALLLAGTGLRAAPQADGSYALQTASAATATQLGKIAVQADADTEGRSEDSDSYTVRASSTTLKLPLSIRETPQTVTIVPQQAIKDFNLKDTRDILQFSPGVNVLMERNTEAYWVTIRGYEPQTQFDNVPAPNGYGGRGNASPDSAFLDRVEVLHGASGLLTGPGNPGGTVNLIHKTPSAEFASSFEAGFDTFGGYRFVGDVGGSITESIGGRMVALYEEQELFVDDAQGKHDGFYGVLEFTPGDFTRILAGAHYERTYDANFGPHYGWPSRPDGTLIDAPREFNMGADWAWQEGDQFTGFVLAEHEFGNGWLLRGMLSHYTTDFDALEAVPGSEETPDIRLFAQIEGWQNESTGIDLYVEGPVEWFGRTHQLMFGFNGSKKHSTNDPYQYALGALAVIDPATWDSRNAPDPFGIPWGSDQWADADTDQYGIFAAGRFQLLDSLHALAGGRVSWVEQTSWESYEEKGVFSPYAGLVWDFAEHWSAYASYSDIFKPHDVSVIDSSGNTLDPTVGENLEAGLKVELYDGAFNAGVAVFRLDQTNLAEDDLDGEFPGICGGPPLDPCQKATGLVRGEGFEATVGGRVVDGLQVIGGYTYLKQRRKTGPNAGQRFDSWVPEQMFNLSVSYTAPSDKWMVGATARYKGEIHQKGEAEWDLDYDGSLESLIPWRIQQESYTVFGVFGRYNVTDAWSIYVAMENVTDEKYLSGISYPAHGQVFGEPRKATLTVTGSF